MGQAEPIHRKKAVIENSRYNYLCKKKLSTDYCSSPSWLSFVAVVVGDPGAAGHVGTVGRPNRDVGRPVRTERQTVRAVGRPIRIWRRVRVQWSECCFLYNTYLVITFGRRRKGKK